MSDRFDHRVGPCAACGRSVLEINEVINGVVNGRCLLDPRPTPDGDTVILDARPTRPADPEDVRGRLPLYRSHFFSCPRHLVEARATQVGGGE